MDVNRRSSSEIRSRKFQGKVKSFTTKIIKDPTVTSKILGVIESLSQQLKNDHTKYNNQQASLPSLIAERNQHKQEIKSAIQNIEFSSSVNSAYSANEKVTILIELIGKDHQLTKEFLQLNEDVKNGKEKVETLVVKLKEMDQVVSTIETLSLNLDALYEKASGNQKVIDMLDTFENWFEKNLSTNDINKLNTLNSTLLQLDTFLNSSRLLKETIEQLALNCIDHKLDNNPTASRHKELAIFKLIEDQLQSLDDSLSFDTLSEKNRLLKNLETGTASINLFLDLGIEVNKEELKLFPELLNRLELYETQLKFIKEKVNIQEVDSDISITKLLQLFESNILDTTSHCGLFLETVKETLFTIINNTNNEDIFNVISENNTSAKWRVSYDVFVKLLLDSADDRSVELRNHAINLLGINPQSENLASPLGITLALLASAEKIPEASINQILSNITQHPEDLLSSVLTSLDSSLFTKQERSAVAGVLTGTLTQKDIRKKEKIIDGLQKKLATPKIQIKVQKAIESILANQVNTKAILNNSFAKQLFNYVSSAAPNLANKETIFGETQFSKSDEVLLALVLDSSDAKKSLPQIEIGMKDKDKTTFENVSKNIQSLQRENPFEQHLSLLKESLQENNSVFANPLKAKRNIAKFRGTHRCYQEIEKIKQKIINSDNKEELLQFSKKLLKNYFNEDKNKTLKRQKKLQQAILNIKSPFQDILQKVFEQTIYDSKSVSIQLRKKVDHDEFVKLDDIKIHDKTELESYFFGKGQQSCITDIELELFTKLPKGIDLEKMTEIYTKEDEALAEAIHQFNLNKTSKIKRFTNFIFKKKPKDRFKKMDTRLSNAANLMEIPKEEFIKKFKLFLEKDHSAKVFQKVQKTIKNRKRLLKFAQRDISQGLQSHKKRDHFIHILKRSTPLDLTKSQLKGIKKARLILVGILNKYLDENPNQDITLLCNEISKKIEFASRNPSVLDDQSHSAYEENSMLKEAYKYLSNPDTPAQIKTYYNAALADLAQATSKIAIQKQESQESTPTTSFSLKPSAKNPKTRYLINRLQDWTDIHMEKAEKKEYQEALIKNQKRFEESDLVAINKDSYKDLFDKTKEGEIIKIEFKNIIGISTKIFKPVLTMVAPGAGDTELTIGYEKNRGISISYDSKKGKFQVSMSRDISKKLALTLKGKIADVTLAGIRDTAKDITFSLDEEKMMELTPHLLQAELTSEDIQDKYYQADFEKRYKASAELSLNFLSAKLPKFIQEPFNEIIGTRQKIEVETNYIERVLKSANLKIDVSKKKKILDEYNAIQQLLKDYEKKYNPNDLLKSTQELEQDIATQSSRINEHIEKYQRKYNLEEKKLAYSNLQMQYQALLEKYPEIKEFNLKEEKLLNDINEALGSRVAFKELTTGFSLKGSRQTGVKINSGGLSQLKYKQYAGSVSLDILGNKMPIQYMINSVTETQLGTEIVLDKFSEESFLYNKYSPFNKEVHEKLKLFNELPLFSLPITVKKGLSEKNKAKLLTLKEEEKEAFYKNNLEIIEISSILPLSETEKNQDDISTSEQVKKQLKSILGYDHNKTIVASQLKRFVLFPLN